MGASLPARVKVMLEVDGADSDITTDVRVDPALTVSRAARSEVDQIADTGSAGLTLDNRDGRYSVLDPESVLWGKIGRNTPIKIGYEEGGSYLDIQDNSAYAYTASVNVAGDLDVRLDARLDNWASEESFDTVMLAGKFATTGNQRSWFFAVRSGRLYLEWSPDGSSVLGRSSTVDIPVKANRRLAVRAVLDVDNGASGHTVTFYTASRMPSNDTDWVQLGDAVTTAGTTSVFASTTLTRVGHGTNLTYDSGRGQYYRFAYYDGASVVRDVDFTTVGVIQTQNAPVITDSTGSAWGLFSGAVTSVYKPRMTGEVASWPPSRHLSGNDVTVAAEVGGLLRRIARATDPVASVLRREVSDAMATVPVAYWPMEDGVSADRVEAVYGSDMMITGSPDMAAYGGFDCSDPIPVLKTGGFFTGSVPAHTSTTEYQVRWIAHPDSTGASANTVVRVRSTGGVARWDVRYTHPDTWTVLAFDSAGVQLASTATNFTPITSHQNDLRMSLEILVDGADVDYQLVIMEVGNPIALVGCVGTVASVAIGRVTSVNVGLGQSQLEGTAAGHLAVYREITSIFDLFDQFNAWAGEAAGNRIKRLCDENSVPFSSPWNDLLSGTTRMDGQRSDSLTSLLEECAKAGQGLLVENRHEASLCFIPPFALENQEPTAVLDYSAGMISAPFEPVVDDKLTVNAFTATRRDGSSYVSEVASGRLSTQAPPDGVGRTAGSETYSLYTDSQTADIATWRTHLGTYEGTRYTAITIELANERAYQSIDDLLSLDFGHMVRLKNAPREHGPDDVDVLVWGVEDVCSGSEWSLSLICVPAEPWRTLVVNGGGRADTEGSELAAGVTSTETTLSVATTSGPLWTGDPAETPFDIRVGGEVMTVTTVGTLLNTNAFLTTNATGWDATNGTVALSTAVVHSELGAVASLLITPNGVSAQGGTVANTSSSAGSVTTGQTYQVSAWIYSPGGWADIRPVIDWYSAANTYLSTSTGSSAMAVPAGVWTHLQQTLTAPASADRLRPRVQHTGTPTAGDIYYAWSIRAVPVASYSSSPQPMTVVRSVNRVVKSHSSGQDVILANPVHIPL